LCAAAICAGASAGTGSFAAWAHNAWTIMSIASDQKHLDFEYFTPDLTSHFVMAEVFVV
jgi:hypothetical protein